MHVLFFWLQCVVNTLVGGGAGNSLLRNTSQQKKNSTHFESEEEKWAELENRRRRRLSRRRKRQNNNISDESFPSRKALKLIYSVGRRRVRDDEEWERGGVRDLLKKNLLPPLYSYSLSEQQNPNKINGKGDSRRLIARSRATEITEISQPLRRLK